LGARQLLALILALGFAAALTACGGSGQSPPSTSGSPPGLTHTVRSPSCERDAGDGVHGPDRLKVLSPCAAFQGIVTEAPVKNSDGDMSFQVSPDPAYTSMLNAHNRSEGGLHIEIVPRDQPGCTAGKPVRFGDIPGLGARPQQRLVRNAPSLERHDPSLSVLAERGLSRDLHASGESRGTGSCACGRRRKRQP
jgi:hypothetical protein